MSLKDKFYSDIIGSTIGIPKEIQDKISMYNCEHRPQMKIVLKELMITRFPRNTKEHWFELYCTIVHPIPFSFICDRCCNKKRVYRINSEYCSDRCEY
jgi:hypothetical protein